MTLQSNTWLQSLKIWMEENKMIMSEDPEPYNTKIERGIWWGLWVESPSKSLQLTACVCEFLYKKSHL